VLLSFRIVDSRSRPASNRARRSLPPGEREQGVSPKIFVPRPPSKLVASDRHGPRSIQARALVERCGRCRRLDCRRRRFAAIRRGLSDRAGAPLFWYWRMDQSSTANRDSAICSRKHVYVNEKQSLEANSHRHIIRRSRHWAVRVRPFSAATCALVPKLPRSQSIYS
jgi:hypothetical protein